jgi:retron-type reverse transcriptase
VKTYRNLYEKICDFENLHAAYLEARKCKRYRDEVLSFTANLEENLFSIQNELLHQTYVVGRYREFFVHEPKKRLVMALPFRDRIVQWALYLVVNPIVTKGYISDSYACITDRGAHEAVAKVHYWMNLMSKPEEEVYYLKMDISKYFYRVDHSLLMKILQRRFPDEQLLWLFQTIIDCEETPFGLPIGCDFSDSERIYDVGMPIGNLSSQLFANLYLNEIDQYIKRELQVRYYVRYMDDMIILSHDKAWLHTYKDLIDAYLRVYLRLSLNNKTAIRPAALGLLFCGYRIWATHIKLSKASARKMKRRLRMVQHMYAKGEIELTTAMSTVTAYFGLLKHCDSYHFKQAIFGDRDKGIEGWFALRRKNIELTADE